MGITNEIVESYTRHLRTSFLKTSLSGRERKRTGVEKIFLSFQL